MDKTEKRVYVRVGHTVEGQTLGFRKTDEMADVDTVSRRGIL